MLQLSFSEEILNSFKRFLTENFLEFRDWNDPELKNMLILEMFNLVRNDDMSWHTTYILTDLGKKFLENDCKLQYEIDKNTIL